MCIEKIVDAPEKLTDFSRVELVRLAGARRSELRNWLVVRGAMTGQVSKLRSNYHTPISNGLDCCRLKTRPGSGASR